MIKVTKIKINCVLGFNSILYLVYILKKNQNNVNKIEKNIIIVVIISIFKKIGPPKNGPRNKKHNIKKAKIYGNNIGTIKNIIKRNRKIR